MRKFVAIILLFSFLFAVDAKGEDEILTGPKIQDREEVIFSSSGEKEGKKEDIGKEAEEAEADEALARVRARAQIQDEEKEVTPPTGKLTPEEQQQVVEFVAKILIVVAFIWLSQVVKTGKTD